MKLTIEIDDDKLKGALDNLPEAALDPLECVGWNYKDYVFYINDHEDRDSKNEAKQYELTLEKFKTGVQLWFTAQATDPDQYALSVNPDDWDRQDIYLIIQMSLFGKLVYS